MSKLQKIYDHMPIPIQELMINGYGLKTYMERYTGVYKQWKRKYLEADYSDFNRLKQEQEAQLVDFLKFCQAHSPYYAKLFKDIDFNHWDVADFNKLPFMTKEFLRTHTNEIATTRELPVFTGGTTGKSLCVYYTRHDMQQRMAFLDAFKEKHGVKLGMRAARFSGKNIIPYSYNPKKNGKYWRTNWIINQRLYSTFHMTEDNLGLYVEDLNKFKPKSLDGFISNIYNIAKYIERHNIKLEFQPIAIFPTSETILPHYRETVERVFNCPVRDQYSSSEGAPDIVECEKGRLHYAMDTGIIEVVDSTNPLYGEVAVTSFTTHGTPLIRYRIGDIIEFSEEQCPCGNRHPVVARIIGRNSDYLYSPERGQINAVNMSNVIKYLPAVQQIQFVQTTENHIDINVVYDKKIMHPDDDELLLHEMRQRFGTKMTFTINKLNEIPREKSGKFRFIKNEIISKA